jgi:peptidoglycan/LPS O-acetylase OafA/YrhL
MIGIPWEVLFVNLAVKILHLPTKQLPLLVWLIFAGSLVPLAALGHHLIEKPARQRMRQWWAARPGHKLASVTTG